MSDNPAEEKEQNYLYNLLSILIIIGIVGIVLWQIFILPTPEEAVPEIRSPKIETSLFEDDTFQRMEYFEIVDIPDQRLIGRDNPFSPFTEEQILEEDIEDED